MIRDRLKEEFVYYSETWRPKFQTTSIRFAANYDYCIAFVESGLRYVKNGCKLGYVITSKVMQALYAGKFRRELLRTSRILNLKDYSLSGIELFRDAINYPLLMTMENRPPTNGDEVQVQLVGSQGILSWTIVQEKLPIDTNDLGSSWSMAPPEVALALQRMRKDRPRLGDRYRVRMGVMTQKDERFIVENIRNTADDDIVLATTLAGDNIRVEKELLCPLVRGTDVNEWTFDVKVYILWPHDKKGNVLENLPNEASAYFNQTKVKNALRKRSDLKPDQMFWTIFRVYEDTLGFKAAWQDLSQKLEAARLPGTWSDGIIGKKPLIPLKTVFFVSPQNEQAAAHLVCLLNSTLVRAFLVAFAERASGSYFRYMAWNMAYIPIPGSFPKTKPPEGEAQASVDSYAAQAYGLSHADVKTLAEYFIWIMRTKEVAKAPPDSTEEDDEETVEP